jgi:hypothetical protein
MIQDTLLWAYAQATQNLGAKQKEVLGALRFFPDATNAEIAAYLRWPVNRITPRCLELRKMGLILDAGKRRCNVTGSTAHARKAKHPVLPPAREESKAPAINSLFQKGVPPALPGRQQQFDIFGSPSKKLQEVSRQAHIKENLEGRV